MLAFLFLIYGVLIVKKSEASLHKGTATNLRLLLEQSKANQGLYRENNLPPEGSGQGWPKETWFQKRLRYIREQQGKKVAEADVVYECALGVITLRLLNGKR